MVVTITTSATNGQWVSLSGTLQEVLDEAADQKLSGHHCVGFTHDGTNYVLVFCRHGG